MASLSNHKTKGHRIHWRFSVRVGPRAGEIVSGSLLLGRCSKAAAKARLREVEAWQEAVKTGRHLPDRSWTEVRAAWLRERKLAYTEQTLSRAERVLALYERWRNDRGLPCKTIEQFANRQDLTLWRDYRLDGEAGRKTVANDFSTLAELFRWCVREKYLPDNPMDRITRPRFIVKKEGAPLTRAQAGRWLASIKPKPGRGARSALTWQDVRRKRHIASFLLNSGLRNGELCALDIDDLRVDEEAQLLHVFGKGLKHRWVPLNRAALAAVGLHLRSRGNPASGPLFTTRTGKRYNVRQLAGELRKTARGHTEDLQVNPHNLRHTFATWLVRTVADVSLAQKILGHENVNTTLRYYVHTGEWELAGATHNLRRKRCNEPKPAPEESWTPRNIKFPRQQVG
jgi:site-specific recombinase XerD